MAFKVAARAVLELGAELISSDEIAIYELVKNAFDAHSPTVEVIFKIRMRRTEYEALCAPFTEPIYEDENGDERKATPAEMQEASAEFIEARDAIAEELRRKRLRRTARLLSESDSCEEARSVLRRAYNRLATITVRDTGDGMNERVLRDAFLTIGTPYRLRERRRNGQRDTRAPLGEKGVGRLSAMRLGSRLEVTTGTLADETWNRLQIDWNRFALDDETLVGDVPLEPFKGDSKEDDEKGTTLESGGAKTYHGSGGIVRPRAE